MNFYQICIFSVVEYKGVGSLFVNQGLIPENGSTLVKFDNAMDK